MSATQFALSLSLLAAPLALSAKSVEQAYVESYQGRTDIPVPVSVVSPEVSSGYAGQVVEIEFVVDATGKPERIALRNSVDSDLASVLTAAVSKWQFSPARVNGQPVAKKVVLPFRIVDPALGSFVAMR